jgi:toxin ParE1/3/4
VIVQWTAVALDELYEAWGHIAQDNVEAADRIVERLQAASRQLSLFPKIGRAGRRARTRELVVAGTKYILIYRVARSGVEILRVRHGRRDWPAKG